MPYENSVGATIARRESRQNGSRSAPRMVKSSKVLSLEVSRPRSTSSLRVEGRVVLVCERPFTAWRCQDRWSRRGRLPTVTIYATKGQWREEGEGSGSGESNSYF